MPDFARFDRRQYATVDAREGYRQWCEMYDATVEDDMDIALLDRIESVRWASVRRAADLGCGTGRTAAWLRSRGVGAIDGVDFTAAMLDVSRRRSLHASLVEADVRATGLPGSEYQLAICSLVDEHLPELTELYREAHRLLDALGTFVVVGFHPFFIMASGMPTHFDGADGTPVAIETYVHLPSEHFAAARAAGFIALEHHERVVDDLWIARKPRWAAQRDVPISFAWVWSRAR